MSEEPSRNLDGYDPNDAQAQAARRRVKGFGMHLIGYFVCLIVIVPLNFWLFPDEAWFLLPLIGWGSVLAVHAAYAMGLFKLFQR
ncbi:MAG: 2TM domain-containing protein [Rhodospirillaceae bacterium]|nr:2TM domain-containing protein [Rhodospirillaceae bacterium]MBT3908516.1 2TM domain-containing protein [Rhodospirillaceae bacterium]MBT5298581.1 2TM domain-containing protein [Rhodospirillaceae bacterium]MBT5512987.1 2TM domain-containing protein [Rhodospirillaceae bacterium]MBT6084260.1 2TM domain-containing protein [Rhodospirillaceae bacterium]